MLYDRIGPYHAARLRGAACFLPIVGFERVVCDSTYAWDYFTTRPDEFRRVALFQDEREALQGRAEVRRRLTECLAGLDPRAVAVPGWGSFLALAAWEWALDHRKGVVLMSESTEWDSRRIAAREAVKKLLVRAAGSGLVGGSPQERYAVALGLPAARVFHGYNAVDNEYFARGADGVRSKTWAIAETLGLKRPFFLASARFVEKKNLFGLIEAYARYRRLASGKPWGLVLAGDGPLGPALRDRIAALDLGGCVTLPGFVQYSKLPDYYGLASVFVHAATTEQWGLVVNEAMASGLPVLVSRRCGCAEDLVVDGVNGFTFDPWRPDELAGLLLRMGSGELDLKAMGSESRRLVRCCAPEVFGEGLMAAVGSAVQVAATRNDWWGRAVVGLAAGISR